jgi:putative MATE family efflux protein
MFTSLFIGLSNGGTVVIAQFYGAGNLDRVRDAIDTIYTAFMASAIPITVIAVLLVRPLLILLQVEESAYADAWLYLTVVCAGLIGAIGYNLNAGILGGLGNSQTTLLFLAVSSVLNIFLDLVLVLVGGLGVLGVALGTIISQAVSWLFGLFYINRRYPDIAIRPFCRRFDKKLFRQIMGIGLPAGVQMSLVAIGSMVVMGRVNAFGKEYTAAYNVGSRLDQLAFLPVQSLSTAVTAFVGQNIGAKRLDRARQGVRVTVISALLWSLVMQVLVPLGPTLVSFFSDTPTVVQAGAVYLKCIMPFYPLFAVMFSLNNAMRGAGDSVFPMVNVILSLILLRVPAVYWFANHYGPDYMYYGIGVGWVLGFALSVVYYLSGRWKRFGSLAEQ